MYVCLSDWTMLWPVLSLGECSIFLQKIFQIYWLIWSDPTPTLWMVSTHAFLHRRGSVRIWPFLILPPLGQPHSAFGGTSASWLFSCFHNPPISVMDYRVFNVCTWLFLCVRLHTGGWAHRWRVSTTFLTWKNSHIFLVLLTQAGFKPAIFGSQIQSSTNWATPSSLWSWNICRLVISGWQTKS